MGNDIFSGLSQLGLGDMAGMNLFEDDKKAENTGDEGVNVKQPEITEEDLLFDKAYTCPCCEKKIKSKTIRAGKNKLVSQDTDLRAKYTLVDPVKYDCIVCNNCGYAALVRYFDKSTSAQLKLIKENISTKFKGVDETAPTYTYDEALVRFQLALANAVVKKARNSEKAFICLKTAWLLRGKAENLPADMEDIEEVRRELHKQEMGYIENSYKGFKIAMQTEEFPICGLDEFTFLYLTAELGRKCKDYNVSMKLVSDIITSPNSSNRIKDKARELKDRIREDVKK